VADELTSKTAKKKRRHPVARVKGCWGADEDERLVRCFGLPGPPGTWLASSLCRLAGVRAGSAGLVCVSGGFAPSSETCRRAGWSASMARATGAP